MEPLAGLGRVDRERLATVLRNTQGTVSVGEAARILAFSRPDTAKLLARWAKQGWLSRIRQGLYVPVPLEARTTEVPLEDPWLIAMRLYAPGYIGGWSAAEYWELTEQIFRTVVVMTTRKPKDRHPTLRGIPFLLRTVSEQTLFGLKSIWRGTVKIPVSDPTRTILDLLSDPGLGGGIRTVTDMLNRYLKSDHRDLVLLVQYAQRLGNGAVFKRLGFLLERLAPEATATLHQCQQQLTAGNAKLDPQLVADKLVTRWRLWIPAGWSQGESRD